MSAWIIASVTVPSSSGAAICASVTAPTGASGPSIVLFGQVVSSV
jgi:hypothetical protein